MNTFSHDGLTLGYETYGDPTDEPLLLIHGLGADHSMWQPQLDRYLTKGYYLIVPDVRGHGVSDLVAEFRLSDCARDIALLFSEIEIDTFGGTLRYSSFRDWFTKALCAFLREVLKDALEDLEENNDRLQGRFDQFHEVFIIDMTVITLYLSLVGVFPGYGDDNAGAKLPVVEAVSTGLPVDFTDHRRAYARVNATLDRSMG